LLDVGFGSSIETGGGCNVDSKTSSTAKSLLLAACIDKGVIQMS
jgi:hypothetical protein